MRVWHLKFCETLAVKDEMNGYLNVMAKYQYLQSIC